MAAVPEFRFPGGDSRTVVIGASGSGKTTFGLWLLSHARFDKRPWIALDYKDEELYDEIGYPPLQRLKLGRLPKKNGLWIVKVRPGEDDDVEELLWRIWAQGNIGLFVDETSLIPQRNAFKAILRQGRSKRIPVIACTQRPVDVDREVFTEASFVSLFRLQDVRDHKIVEGFTGIKVPDAPLKPHWSYWFDVARHTSLQLRPTPKADIIAQRLRQVVPYQSFFFGA